MEATLQPLMYNTPSENNIKSITVTAKTVDGGEAVIEKKE
jgi:ATP-dependent protease Clp ATPase subunit